MENVDLMQLLLSPEGRVNRAKWGTWFGTWGAWIIVIVFAGVVRRDIRNPLNQQNFPTGGRARLKPLGCRSTSVRTRCADLGKAGA